jgi:hypothetical protein
MNPDAASAELEAILRELLQRANDGSALEEIDVARALGVLRELFVTDVSNPVDVARLEAFYQLLMAWGTQQERGFSREFRRFLGEIIEQIPAHRPARGHLLALMVSSGAPEDTEAFVDPFLETPPSHPVDALRPLIALMRQGSRAVHAFPKLLDGLSIPHIAPGILDIANSLARQHHISPHPATPRLETLIRQLQAVVAALEVVTPEATSKLKTPPYQIAEAVSLAIPLADTLAWIRDPRAIPVLSHLAQLPHRRLRVEAESALVRLGVAESREKLAAFAAEPVVRLYALKYAEELELAEQIDERFTSPEALAEAELVMFLAQPQQLGFPPSPCDLVDTRVLRWPGFEEPRNCYLFRFAFPVPGPSGEIHSEVRLGIAGPLTFAFSADLSHLDPLDHYAAFAGFQAEHDEIAEVRLPTSSKDISDRVRGFTDPLQMQGFDQIKPRYWGTFFGEDYLVAEGIRDGIPGCIAIDRDSTAWFPLPPRLSPMGPEHVVYIYKGRRLLASFNPESWN